MPESTLVHSRLAVLRFPPPFFAAIAASPLGGLAALWQRLGEDERAQLTEFERAFRPGLHHEMRGHLGRAAEIYRTLVDEHPRFRGIVLERLRAIGQPLDDAEAPDG